jgi:hypothetical protein
MEQTIREFMEFAARMIGGLHSIRLCRIFCRFIKTRLAQIENRRRRHRRFGGVFSEWKCEKELRQAVNRLEKCGLHTAHCEPPISDEVIVQLQEVSDEWLQIPGRRERRFTLGLFESNYIRSTPVFVAVDRDGKILAFVNIVPSYGKGEATVDLLRRRTEAPNGIMDFLLIKLFFESTEQGFTRFNLGMAPMSGFENAEATPENASFIIFSAFEFFVQLHRLAAIQNQVRQLLGATICDLSPPLDLPRLALAIREVSELK